MKWIVDDEWSDRSLYAPSSPASGVVAPDGTLLPTDTDPAFLRELWDAWDAGLAADDDPGDASDV